MPTSASNSQATNPSFPCFAFTITSPRRDHPGLHREGARDVGPHREARTRRMVAGRVEGRTHPLCATLKPRRPPPPSRPAAAGSPPPWCVVPRRPTSPNARRRRAEPRLSHSARRAEWRSPSLGEEDEEARGSTSSTVAGPPRRGVCLLVLGSRTGDPALASSSGHPRVVARRGSCQRGIRDSFLTLGRSVAGGRAHLLVR
jgi:hypothetical protein